MRILVATAEYPPHAGGGIARYYYDLTTALAHAGADVTVVVASPFSDDFDAYEHDGVRVRFVSRDAVDRHSAGMPHVSAAPVFRRAVAAARAATEVALHLGPFDVVETTDFALQFVPFVLNEAFGPVVVQCHGSMGQVAAHEPRRADLELDQSLARLTESTVLPMADDVQTYGSPNAEEWEARLGRPVRVLPPPFRRSGHGAWQPGRQALVVGRIQPWKGPHVLCRAWQMLPDSSRPEVLWVGRDTPTASDGSSLDAALRQEYPDIWGPIVQPGGQRDAGEILRLQQTARFVVVPSEWDVFNFTAVEAMAAGVVVICSDGAGARDLIEDGVNGFVFRAGDAAHLARRVQDVLSLGEAEARAIGDNAKAVVATELDPNAVAESRLSVYGELSSTSRASRRVPDWTRSFYDSQASAQVSTAFLDQWPIRELSRYLGDRLQRRVRDRRLSAAGRSRR